jgi:hypothetical protein
VGVGSVESKLMPGVPMPAVCRRWRAGASVGYGVFVSRNVAGVLSGVFFRLAVTR